MKCLIEKTASEFLEYVKNDLGITNWKIMNATAKERLEYIVDNDYFQILQTVAKDKNITANNTEILSWLDTTKLMYQTLKDVRRVINADEISILQEYEIPYTHKRADYILTYQNKILIIEFSFDKFSDEYKYETKLTQALGYKELISNLMPANIEIGTYTFLINPEVDQNFWSYKTYNKYSKNKTDQANIEKITDLQNFIIYFFENKNKAAITCLKDLEKYVNKYSEHIPATTEQFLKKSGYNKCEKCQQWYKPSSVPHKCKKFNTQIDECSF